MPGLLDRIKETSTSVGTGDFDLDGAVSGYRAFSLFGTGNQCYYTIVGDTEWETGIGTVTVGTPNSISRDTVLASSNSNSLVSFSAGSKVVFCDIPASQLGLGRFGGYSTDYLYSTTTSASGIAATYLRLNNASFASVSHVFVHKSQRYNVSVAAFLASIANSGNYGYIKIYKESTLDDNWIFLRVTALTDQITYVDLTVTYVDSHGSFSASDVLVLTFSPTGPQGVAGAQGPVGVGVPGPAGAGAVNLIDNPMFYWDQLNKGGAGTAAACANDAYIADRWYALLGTDQDVDYQIIDSSATTIKGIKLTPTNVGSTEPYYGIAQILNYKKTRNIVGALSLSCKIWTNATRVIRYALLYATIPDWTGPDDTLSDPVLDWTKTDYSVGNFFKANWVVLDTDVLSTTAVTHVTATAENIAMYGAANNLLLMIWCADPVTAADDTFEIEISEVSLVQGSKAMGWAYPNPGEDFRECCSYFQKSNARNVAPAGATGKYCGIGLTLGSQTNPVIAWQETFPVKMVKDPTITTYDTLGASGKATVFGSTGATPLVTQVCESGFTISTNTGYTGTNVSLYFKYAADANL